MRNRSNMIFFLFYSIPKHWHITFILCCIIKILFSLHIILRSFMKIVPLKVYDYNNMNNVFLSFSQVISKPVRNLVRSSRNFVPRSSCASKCWWRTFWDRTCPSTRATWPPTTETVSFSIKKNINYCKVSVILYYCSIIYA